MILPESERKSLLESFPDGVVALDLETTGLSPLIDQIIEVAAIKVTPHSTESFSELVHPQIDIPTNTISIHGITDAMVANSRRINQVLPDFFSFIEELPLIAHNAKFDLGFLLFDLHQLGTAFPANKVYCSCKFSRDVFTRMPNHRLGTLAKELQIELKNHHRATDDAMACLRVVAKGLGKGHKNSIKSSYLFAINDFDPNADWEIPADLEKMKPFLETQETIALKYRGGSFKNQFRPVRPIAFLPMPEGNILYGHCLKTNLYKSFSLKKIIDFRKPTPDEKEEWLQEWENLKEAHSDSFWDSEAE